MGKGKFSFDLSGLRVDEVLSNVEKATKDGIDEVMSDCVGYIKRRRAGRHRLPTRGVFKIVEPARKDGGEIAGVWGSTDINYALAIETGDFSYLQGQPSDGERVETRKNKGNRGSLRKAADQHYRELPDAIARRTA